MRIPLEMKHRCALMFIEAGSSMSADDMEAAANCRIVFSISRSPSLSESIVDKLNLIDIFLRKFDLYDALLASTPLENLDGFIDLVVFDHSPIDAMFGIRYLDRVVSRLMIDDAVLDTITEHLNEFGLAQGINTSLIEHLSAIADYARRDLVLDELITSSDAWIDSAIEIQEQLEVKLQERRSSIVDLLSSGWQ